MSGVDFPDPSKTREERRAEAANRASSMTPERRDELLKKFGHASSKPRREPIPSYGTMDAVSLPIYEERGPDPFMTGPSNDFLLPIGAGKTSDVGMMPQQLRRDGWVFLRAGGQIVARARFTGFEHRESRIEHVPSLTGYEDRGPGMVLAVDPTTWEHRADPLESDRESGNGYRYYMMDGDRPVWTLAGG